MTSTEVSTPSETNQPAEVHVLAVDDSFIDRRLIEKLLKTSSFKVTAVDSGRRALEVLGVAEGRGGPSVNSLMNECSPPLLAKPYKQGFQVHLVITDYCMPGMSGYDLLKKIKGISELKEIPVVVMSSENVPTRISSCLAEGAEEFLLKPVQLADVKRLRGHIRNSGCTTCAAVADGGCKRKLPLDEVLLQGPARRVCLNKRLK